MRTIGTWCVDEGAFQTLANSFQGAKIKLTSVAQWLLDNADTSGSRPKATGF